MTADPSGAPEAIQRFVEDEFLARHPGLHIALDDDLIDTGYLDSVGVFRLVGFLEEEFGIEMPPTAIVPENLSSINAIAGYVQRTLSDRTAGP